MAIIKQTQPEDLLEIAKKIKNKDIEIVLDTETTGVNPDFDRILEFGAIVLENGIEIDRIHFYTNPYLDNNPPKTKDIPKAAEKIHNINRKFLEGEENSNQDALDIPAKSFSEYSKGLKQLLENHTIVAHNAKFDIGMINSEFKRVGIKETINKTAIIIDTLTIFRSIINKEELEEKGLKGYSLDTLIEYAKKIKDFEDIDREFHGALKDSEILKQAYEVLKPIAKDIIELIKSEHSKQTTEKEYKEFEKKEIKSNIYFKTDRAISEGMVDIEEIVKKAKENNIKTLTLMDTYRTNGHRKFFNIAKENGVKPQIGSTINIKVNDEIKKINVIVKNSKGYKELNQLITVSFENSEKEPYLIFDNFNKEDEKGRKVSFDNLEISVPQTEEENIFNLIEKIKETYNIKENKTIYIEPINKTILEKQKKEFNKKMDLNTKIHLTHEVLYIEEKDFDSYKSLKNIILGKNGEGKYFKNKFEDLKNNSFDTKMISEKEEGLEQEFNNKEINYNMDKKRTIFPKYPVELNLTKEEEKSLSQEDKEKKRHELILEEFVKSAKEGLKERIKELNPTKEKEKILYERLENEINIILEMEEMQKGKEDPMAYAEYFLFVKDYVSWAKENGILVGPGRGSGAGSLIAYAMRITEIEVTEFDLVFERFINKERVSEPDFDIDFSGEVEIEKIKDEKVKKYIKEIKSQEKFIDGKELAIKYMSVKYPKSQVAKTLTEGTIQAKSAIADVIRVFGSDFAQILFDNNEELADMIRQKMPKVKDTLTYNNLSDFLKSFIDEKKSLKENIEDNQTLNKLYENSNIIKKILDISLKLENKIKSYGAHASAIVLDFDLDKPVGIINGEYVYLQTMYDSELVKFDFLGLKTLDVIYNAKKTVKERENKDIDFKKINYKDEKTFELISEGDTKGVFQIESKGMQDLNKRTKPKSLEDIIAILSLYRPGPMQSGMLDDFIERKNGANITYNLGEQDFDKIEKILEKILEPTLGVVVYQEQVLKIVREIGGFSYGEADIVRRAMGKKDLEKMKEISEEFAIRANKYCQETHNIYFSKEAAKKLFNIIEKFAGYGFNKSHPTAYSMISFETAYLKAHYPLDFYNATFNNKIDDIEKVGEYILDAKEHEIEITPPDINQSQSKFTIKDNKIFFALSGIKGVGEKEVEKILKEREENGEFKSIEELMDRVFLKKNTMENLILSGAFDKLKKISNNIYQDRIEKLKIYYDFEKGKKKKIVEQSRKLPESVSEGEFYNIETERLGAAITAKSVLDYKHTKQIFYAQNLPLEEVLLKIGKIENYKVVVDSVKEVKTKKGDKMAFITLTDGKTKTETVCFPKNWNGISNIIEPNKMISINGEVKEKNNTTQILINNAKAINIKENQKTEQNKDTETNKKQKDLIIKIESGFVKMKGKFPKEIETFLKKVKETSNTIHYHDNGDFWSIQIKNVYGEELEFNKKLYKRIIEVTDNELIIIKTKENTNEQERNKKTIIEQDAQYASIKHLKDSYIINLLTEIQEEKFIFYDKEKDAWKIQIFEDERINKDYIKEDLEGSLNLLKQIKRKLDIPVKEEYIKELIEENKIEELKKGNTKEIYKKAKKVGVSLFAEKGSEETNAIILQEFLPKSIEKNRKENKESVAKDFFDFFKKQPNGHSLKPILLNLRDRTQEDNEIIDTDSAYNFIQLMSEINDVELLIIPNYDNNSPIIKTLKLKNGLNEIKIGDNIKKIFVSNKNDSKNILENLEKELKKEKENNKNNKNKIKTKMEQ